MGFLGKLIGLGVLGVAGLAAIKVAKKYDENKKEEACAADFVNEEGNTIVEDVKKATKDVYQDTAEKVSGTVKTAAENIGIDTDEVSTAFGEVGTATVGAAKAVANASVAVASKVKKEAPVVFDNAVTFVSNTTDKVKKAITPKDEELEEYLTGEDVIIVDAPEECAEEVVDVQDCAKAENDDTNEYFDSEEE